MEVWHFFQLGKIFFAPQIRPVRANVKTHINIVLNIQLNKDILWIMNASLCITI